MKRSDFEEDRQFSMLAQEKLAVPLLERLFNARVESLDLKNRDFDFSGIDKRLSLREGRLRFAARRVDPDHLEVPGARLGFET